MSKVFLILAVLLALGAAGLGYMNTGKLQAVREEAQSTRQQLEDLKPQVAEKENAIAEALAKLEQAEAQKSAAESAKTQLQTQLQAAKDEADSAKSALKSKEDQIADLQTKLDAAIAAKVAETEQPAAAPAVTDTELEEMRTQIAELETLRDSLTARVQTAETRVQSLEAAEQARVATVMKRSTEGRVLAYNAEYNFVVVSLGDSQGAVPDAELIVKRGANLIGKVRITRVERGQSIADVIRSSVAKGVRIQPGDTVVFGGDA